VANMLKIKKAPTPRYIRLNEVRPFDVILCRSSDLIGDLISSQNRSKVKKHDYYSHAALVVGSQYVFEAVQEGVRLISLRYHANHGPLQEPWPEQSDCPPSTTFDKRQLIKISDRFADYDIYRPQFKKPNGTPATLDDQELNTMLEDFQRTTLQQEQHKSYASLLSTAMASQFVRGLDQRAQGALGMICSAIERRQSKKTGLSYEAAKAAAEHGRFCSDLVEYCFATAGHPLFPGQKSTEITPNDLASRLLKIPDAIVAAVEVSFPHNEAIKKDQLSVNRQDAVLANMGVSLVSMKVMLTESRRHLEKQQGQYLSTLEQTLVKCDEISKTARALKVALTISVQLDNLSAKRGTPSWNKPIVFEHFTLRRLLKGRQVKTFAQVYAETNATLKIFRETEKHANAEIRWASISSPEKPHNLNPMIDHYLTVLSRQRSFRQAVKDELALVPFKRDPLKSMITLCNKLEKQGFNSYYAVEKLIRTVNNQPPTSMDDAS
jgi:hypothetical protein